MSTVFKQRGETIPYANSSGSTITAGTFVPIVSGNAGFGGVAVKDIPDGETGDLQTEGVCELTINDGDDPDLGGQLYWDAGNDRLTTTSSTHTRAGRAWGPETASNTVLCKLHGS